MRKPRHFARLAGAALTVWALLTTPMPAPAGTPPGETTIVDAARKRVAAGELSGAIKDLTAYVAAHPRESEPARYLGDLQYRAADSGAAERTYRAILLYAPDDRLTHDRLGGIYAAQDRVDEALAQFEKSLPVESAYGHLVDLHRRLGDLARFEQPFKAGAEGAPFDAGAQYAYGVVLLAERKAREAVPYLERALGLAPLSCSTQSELGIAYLDLKRTDKAVEVLQRCLAHAPDNYSALVNLAAAFIAQQQYERAHVALDRALAVHADGPEALVNLGYLEDVGRNWQRAIADYSKAINVDPYQREAYVDLGFDYGEHKLFSLAEAAYLKGLSVSPDDGRLHYLLAATYADQGKRELARAEYRRASKSDEPEIARAATINLSTLQ